MSKRIFGPIPGIFLGTVFESRKALAAAAVHRPVQAVISGSGIDGADSIVISGGYEDDRDLGDEIIYTGHGGRDPQTGKQIADQTLTVGNLGLAISQVQGLPVRVIRGYGHYSEHAPKTGYKYDGLYRVVDHWREKGTAGFFVWRFRLVKAADEFDGHDASTETPSEGSIPERRLSTVLRIVRDSRQARRVKELHEFACQVCGIRLETAAGPYAEGAHIRPLGEPHNGPDSLDNLLCLCPNHHVLFDLGSFSIDDNLRLVGIAGKLRTDAKHVLSTHHLQYHREHYLNTIN